LALELEACARQLDALFSADETLSEPIPFPGLSSHPEPGRVRWTKPLLVLIDELSVSAGDLFPLLIKSNHLDTLFGQGTSGAGGNVEVVTQLPHSAVQLALTRGSFTVVDPSAAHPDERFVEDNGVTPDLEYSHTVADFRAGYVGYVEGFSKAAVEFLSY
jgi:C-terminal processing protease CtpA/Prc